MFDINLFYEDLPNTVTIKGREYSIITDFREWIRFVDMLKDKELPTSMKVSFMLGMIQEDIDISEIPVKDVLLAFSDFLACRTEHEDEEQEAEDTSPQAKEILSYKIDAPYIISAFLECYKMDLLEIPYMHWWKFRALFNGLSENTEIKKRIYYRSLNLSEIKDKEERKRIRKIQQQIQLPQEAISDGDIANAFT